MSIRGKRRSVLQVVAIVVLALSIMCVFGSNKALAAGNPEISFEGKVVNTTGETNITDGSYNMEFIIYTGCTNEPTSNTGCTAVWTEDHLVSATQAIAFTSGTFQVNLGSICGFTTGSCQGYSNTAVPWDSSPLYLSMQIGNTSATGCTAPLGVGNFATDCGGDGVMSPYIELTATPYAEDSAELGGLSSSSYGQLSATQTWSAKNIFQPTGNVNSVTVVQSSTASPTADIFDVQTQNNTNVIQVTGPSVNNAAVNIASVGGTNAISLDSAGALTFTGNAASTWDIGAAHTLSLQTTNNGPITTGTGLFTTGGSLSVGGNVSIASGDDYTGAGTVNLTSGGSSALNLDTSNTAANIVIGVTNAPVIVIGSNSTTNTTQHLLQLNSYDAFADSPTCSTSSNQGALYYNTVSNDIRACINGNWEDMASTSGLGILLFGVVPDSSNAGQIGDLGGISGNTNSPCKTVIGASTTQVIVEACTAYSGGRKVIVNQTTINTTNTTLPANDYANICLTGTNDQPALLTAAASDAGTTEPAFSANNPILCLATIKATGTAGTVGDIYDIRTFTNTQKTFTTTDTTSGLGMVMYNSAANEVAPVTTTPEAKVAGVSIAYSGTISTNSINMIIATGGPQWVKALATATTADEYAEAGGATTTGYAGIAAAVPAGGFEALGMNSTVYNAGTCTTNANCQASIFLNPLNIDY